MMKKANSYCWKNSNLLSSCNDDNAFNFYRDIVQEYIVLDIHINYHC